MTAGAGPALRTLHRQFGNRVEFLTVYVREAHPGERYPQPDTFDEKLRHARAYKHRDRIPWTVAVDDVQGSFHQAVDAKPNAAYFIDTDGRIVYRTLWSNDERALREGFERLLSRNPAAARGERLNRIIPILNGTAMVDEVLGEAGDQAREDFRQAMPPVYGLAKLASMFRPLPPVLRTMAAGTALLAAAGVAGTLGWRAVHRAA